MLVASGGGSSGHFVGLDPSAARALTGQFAEAGDRASVEAWQITWLLAAAGPEASGATTPTTLRTIASGLDAAAADLKWRIEMLTAGAGTVRSGGMLLGTLPFASAAAARTAGRRHAEAMKAALRRYLDADGDEAAEAMADYQSLVRTADTFSTDPAWSGGLINSLGTDGIDNAVWFTMREVEGDVEQTHSIIAPLATVLATAMRHRTASPVIADGLLRWPNQQLGVLLTAAPAETNFLVRATRSRLVDAAWTPEWTDDLLSEDAGFFLEALGRDAEASYRVITGVGPTGERNVVYVLQPLLHGRGGDGREAARVLEQALVVYPAGRSAAVWNEATETTEIAIGVAARMNRTLDDFHPDLSDSLLTLLHPHLDAVARIGIESSEIDIGSYDVDRPLPGGRQSLDVSPEDLRNFLGGVLQSEETIGHMQALLASYAQSPEAQAHRVPLLDGRVSEALMADSLRTAGLIGITGQGLEIAGHDEESRTKLLAGGLQFVSKQGINKVVGWSGPLGFAVKQTAGRGVAWAADEFRDWVAGFEPIEGEEGVDAFLQAFDDNTEASLRDHIANDPDLAALPAAERERRIDHAVRIAGDMVRAQLLTVYADMTGETVGESK